MRGEVHAEVAYGEGAESVHSDICPREHFFFYIDDEYREFLHANLDEWLNNSNGTGFFYIGNVPALADALS